MKNHDSNESTIMLLIIELQEEKIIKEVLISWLKEKENVRS